MKPRPPFNLAPHLHVILNLAFRIAPKKDKAWIEDMGFELGFIKGQGARLRWALSSLNLSFKMRMASLTWNVPPRGFILASLMVATVVSMVVFLPWGPNLPLAPSNVQSTQNETQAVSTEESTQSQEDLAPSQRALIPEQNQAAELGNDSAIETVQQNTQRERDTSTFTAEESSALVETPSPSVEDTSVNPLPENNEGLPETVTVPNTATARESLTNNDTNNSEVTSAAPLAEASDSLNPTGLALGNAYSQTTDKDEPTAESPSVDSEARQEGTSSLAEPGDRLDAVETAKVEPSEDGLTSNANDSASSAFTVPSATTSPLPNVQKQVSAPSLSLIVLEKTRVEVYEGTLPEKSKLLLARTVQAGETFEFKVPLYLYTDNAGGLEVRSKDEVFSPLGLSKEEKNYVFQLAP